MRKYRKIWLSVAAVVVPFIITCAVLFAMPFDKRFGYYFVKDNCIAQAGHIYDRLHYNDKPVDVAFFGTSHTIDAVSDYWIEDTLAALGNRRDIMNMGYCRFGRNMPYLLLKEMLETKPPKYIVLEVTEKENRDGHMDFGYMADSRDILMPELIFNDNIFEDMFKGLVVRFECVKQKMFGQYQEPELFTPDFLHRMDWSVVDQNLMAEQKANKLKNHKYSKGFSRWFYNQCSFNYLDKTIALAEEHGIKVLFIYLPEYASIPVPEELQHYKKRGHVLMPPDSIYQRPTYWKDVRHMNDSGAVKMSGWLARELNKEFTQPR